MYLKTLISISLLVILSALGQLRAHDTSQEAAPEKTLKTLRGKAPKPLSEMELFDKTKEGVVSIETRVSHGAYTARGVRNGTGFLVDKKHGFIITNRHVAASASVGVHFITFFSGRQLVAHKIYEDPYHDFAILQVDPADIPPSAIALTFSLNKPKTGDGIVIVGKNEGQDFSFHTGRVSSLYEITGYLPGQSMRLSLNTRGGSSGSPVFNTQGQVIALNHSGSDTSAFALHTSYITQMLNVFRNEPDTLQRWEMGVDLSYDPVDKLVRHLNFPKDIAATYREDYTDASGKILVVERTHKGSPARNLLKPGDVLWALNDTPIGPHLERLQLLINKSGHKPLKITVIRDGKKVDVSFVPQMVLDHQITRFVEFGGGIFFAADDFTNSQTGCGIGAVVVNAIDEGGAFYQVFRAANLGSGLNVRVTKLNNHSIKTLNDFIEAIPSAVKKEHFGVQYSNYGVSPGYNSTALTTRSRRSTTVTFSSHQSSPRLFTFDRKERRWSVKLINVGAPKAETVEKDAADDSDEMPVRTSLVSK
ncbi:trypsin-like peptidase domain-containing protein [Alphaproteobacteria bacterium]|nr:trypsin-like peptidase domain-containing protein [Alphaproteobacteria bacterium]